MESWVRGGHVKRAGLDYYFVLKDEKDENRF